MLILDPNIVLYSNAWGKKDFNTPPKELIISYLKYHKLQKSAALNRKDSTTNFVVLSSTKEQNSELKREGHRERDARIKLEISNMLL